MEGADLTGLWERVAAQMLPAEGANPTAIGQQIEAIREALKHSPRDPDLYLKLAQTCRGADLWDEAIAALEAGIGNCPRQPSLHHQVLTMLRQSGRTSEMLAAGERAVRLLAWDPGLRLRNAMLLPMVYEDQQEIEFFRDRFAAGVADLTARFPLDTAEAVRRARDAIALESAFYLPYQGRDVLPQLSSYGALVGRIMAASYPQWAARPAMPAHGAGERLRVGFVSSCFYSHSVSKTHGGWLQCLREMCDVYGYHVDIKTDAATQQIREYCTAFRHFPFDFEAMCRAIAGDRLHVLIYLDIGMHSWTTQLAGLRLAPVQCNTWGQPVTSGMQTLDYYLSSDLMEPADGQRHYSEELIRLAGNGIYYPEPAAPAGLTKTRRDFGLREDAVVYLCCQSLYKYLPRHDAVVAEIAQRVPDAQFAFLSPNPPLAGKFCKRLQRAFAARGLNCAEHCVMLPRLDPVSYWNLNRLADVFLDSLVWSGCNTTLEAIACGLPVVTCPGEFMRGRHSYAILKTLGVEDTVAGDETGYVDLAVRLGTDPAWRARVAGLMERNRSRLYADRAPIGDLEEFLRRAVERHTA